MYVDNAGGDELACSVDYRNVGGCCGIVFIDALDLAIGEIDRTVIDPLASAIEDRNIRYDRRRARIGLIGGGEGVFGLCLGGEFGLFVVAVIRGVG